MRVSVLCRVVVALGSAAILSACQSPTDPDDSLKVDDFLVVTADPAVATAEASTDGRTYRVARNELPDEILPFDWKTSFVIHVTLNDQADDDDYLTFPVTLSTVAVKVNQASGGIITPPTGGEVEHSDYVVTQSSGNAFSGINTSHTMTFDVWYDLPSLRKEAVIALTLTFVDDDGVTFSKVFELKVAP